MQTPSGHCRCKKTQTSSRHEPKTAQTARHHLDTSRKPPKPHAKKLFHVTNWNPHKTIFGATEHMPSLCKHHVDTADAKRPKHRAQTPTTSKLLGALPLCEGVGGYHNVTSFNSSILRLISLLSLQWISLFDFFLRPWVPATAAATPTAMRWHRRASNDMF